MDPVSIAASLVTLVGATKGVVNLIRQYSASVKGAKRDVIQLTDEINRLRSCLEFLAQSLKIQDHSISTVTSDLKAIKELCDPESGDIAKELRYINEKLRLPSDANHQSARGIGLLRSLTWPLKEKETKKLLETVERLKSSLELALNINQTGKLAVIQHTQEENFRTREEFSQKERNDKQFKEIMSWLSAPDPSLNFQAALKRRQTNTGTWLFENQKYREWKANSDSFLWLHGIPGCGKTVLSSTVVEDLLKETPNAAIAYYYFDFNDNAKQHYDEMLCSLVLQLFSQHETITDSIASMYEASQNGVRSPQSRDLKNAFRGLIQKCDKTFVILDALDECESESREEVFTFLNLAAKWKSGKLSVMMTSRKLRDIEELVELELEQCYRLSIQNSKVDEDIRSYVRGKLQSDRKFERWQKKPEVHKEIERRLMKKSNGMFRWAACQLDVLSECLSLIKLRQALDSLPPTLDETYDRILCSIHPTYMSEVLHILQWLTFSKRPLSLEEVAEIVAFNGENCSQFDGNSRLAEPKDILRICSSLVVSINVSIDHGIDQKIADEVDVQSDITLKQSATIISLAHYSVKEYLVSERIRFGPANFFSIEEDKANTSIGTASLACLNLLHGSYLAPANLTKKSPLLGYSAQFWHVHLSKIDGPARPLVLELFQSEHIFANWIFLHDLDHKHSKWYNTISLRYLRHPLWSFNGTGTLPEVSAPSLYYAVLTGLIDLVDALIFLYGRQQDAQEPTDSHTHFSWFGRKYPTGLEYINATGGKLHTAIQAASYLGRIDIVKLLIKHGADPNQYGGSKDGSALSAAAQGGHFDIVTFLLSNGADVNEGLLSNTSVASRESSLEAIDSKLETLQESCTVHSRAAVADERSMTEKRVPAFWHGACLGGAEIVNFMLDHGAMIDMVIGCARDRCNSNARGKDGEQGDTALIAAAKGSDSGLVEILLKRGALVNKANYFGWTPLHFACDNGAECTVRLLLDHGANVNHYGKRNTPTPLVLAINRYWKDNDDIVKLLLEYGAHINLDIEGVWQERLPRYAAVAIGTESVVQKLIAHEAKIEGKLPLVAFPTKRRKNIAMLLAKDKAIINATISLNVRTGVPLSLSDWDITTLRCLAGIWRGLDYVSNVSFRPKRGNNDVWQQENVGTISLLWIAAAQGDAKSVEMLLNHGANPEHFGPCAVTPLDVSIFEGHKEVVKLLLKANNSLKCNVESVEDDALYSLIAQHKSLKIESVSGRQIGSTTEVFDNSSQARISGTKNTAIHAHIPAESTDTLPTSNVKYPLSCVMILLIDPVRHRSISLAANDTQSSRGTGLFSSLLRFLISAFAFIKESLSQGPLQLSLIKPSESFRIKCRMRRYRFRVADGEVLSREEEEYWSEWLVGGETKTLKLDFTLRKHEKSKES